MDITDHDPEKSKKKRKIARHYTYTGMYFTLIGGPSCTETHLRTRESGFWPSERFAIGVQQGVFLFDAEPRLLVRRLGHHLQSSFAVIGFFI